MLRKHAYLLMLHHRKDLADLLLEAIDDARNDIYVHIDKKCKEFSFADLKVKYAGLYEVKNRADVNWGGYSQIKCEIQLMKTAKRNGSYAYYHLLQDASYPLKSQDEIHQFYDDNQGIEYIAIDGYDFYDRIQYMHLFNDLKLSKRLYDEAEYQSIKIQKYIKYDRFKQFNMEFKKGFSLWSITDDLLSYVLSKEKLIKKMMKYSHCGDEIFMQVIAYNSPFKDKISYIDDNKQYSSSMWCTTWVLEDNGIKRKKHNFELEDLSMLMDGSANFARKFEGDDGLALINLINQNIKKV